MTDRNIDIGQRIKKALEIAKKQQKALADKMGISQPTVSNCLSGVNKVPIEMVIATAELTGATLEWLITGEGPMRNESVEISGSAVGAESNGSAPTDEEMEDLPKPFIEVIKEGYKLTLSNQYRIAADMLDKIGELIAEEERKKRKEEGDK
ncbi:MAG: Bacteriophage CI repressor helix-turn-helix domain protein [Syntrophus sp. PtaB.Bin138]|nr:helix-turn-helix domain-containing protein [Geobacteraceae bacterium]OPY14663.1 MAG: Bacteriophage CI repressor helix-turn-helix domain protein [Syntrophus sp. PtaB.Bin138]